VQRELDDAFQKVLRFLVQAAEFELHTAVTGTWAIYLVHINLRC
jgi:hypothetical protein